MKDKVKIDKIDIIINKKTISLTAIEIKELQQILNETFPENKTTYLPNVIIIDRPTWPQPYKYWQTPEPYCVNTHDDKFQCLTITCNSNIT